MKNWILDLPVPVEFGSGCVRQLPKYLRGARRVLLVTGRHAMRAAGVTDQVCTLLADAGCQVQLFEGILPDPEYGPVEEAAALARQLGIELVIGLGGGSAMDSAKAIAVAATHDGPIMEYAMGGSRQITAATLPVLAISATSGTGSHIGRVAVLSDHRRAIKRGLASDALYPRAAFCDPEILRHMPPEVTAVTGWDAFAHALEGFLSRNDNPIGKLCAREAMAVIHRALPGAIRNGDDLELRQQMAWGDTLAGISLAANAIITAHSFSMVLGGRYGLTHGRAIASVTVASIEHSRAGAVDKLAEVARLLGCRTQGTEGALADWAIAAIEKFIADIGLGRSLASYGVPKADFPAVAQEVSTAFRTRVDNDPVPADTAKLLAIMHRSVARWEAYESGKGE